MRFQFILPPVEPKDITPPALCPYENCEGTRFRLHARAERYINDPVYSRIVAHRYQCERCGRTFRVYPKGVGKDRESLRVRGLAIILYSLGMSYGATSEALEALGVHVSKSGVHDIVQQMVQRLPASSWKAILPEVRVSQLAGDLVTVKWDGDRIWLALLLNDPHSTILRVTLVHDDDVDALETRLEAIAGAAGGLVFLRHDADTVTRIADSPDLEHQDGHAVW